MNYKMIKYFFGIMLMLEAAFMLIPTATALIYSEDITPFIITTGILLFFGNYFLNEEDPYFQHLKPRPRFFVGRSFKY